ncbi:MAG TPA: DHA2 family efflux MFS transporter permease subunit [Trebonia sp.]|nr:DHA2 family efflux MFS transporter permease subunit [Trebonia sp.]
MSQTQSATSAPDSARADAHGARPGLALLLIAAAQLMVVLDATVVYVALPYIQRALGFSGTGLEWVVNAYALTFGGLLLLGGRAGDLLGRRRMFAAGLLLFSTASLAGGLATSPAWLLAARAVQGVGGAVVAPAALALIAASFPEGPKRSRAMGVYASMSAVGGALGLVAGGLLVTYASWRWVLFINVPIGIAVALTAPFALGTAGGTRARQPGGFDLRGAVTGTGGIAALVYGLSNAATTPGGVSHWGDARVVASLAAGVVLLAAFAVIEARGRHPLLPPRLLRDRDRLGANLIMLGVGTAVFGVFFFLALFVQDVWGYSALRTGVAFLPYTAALLAASTVAARLVSRAGARPLLLAGGAASVDGMYWLSRVTGHSTYAAGLLGPSLVAGAGIGLLFVPLPLVALSRVAESDSGVASSLLNTGRQVGGALGLAVLGTVAWTVTADSARSRTAGLTPAAAYARALAAGLDRAFLVAAGIAVLILVTAALTIRPATASR